MVSLQNATYQYEAIIYFDGEIIDGYFPAKQIKLVSALVVIHEKNYNMHGVMQLIINILIKLLHCSRRIL